MSISGYKKLSYNQRIYTNIIDTHTSNDFNCNGLLINKYFVVRWRKYTYNNTHIYKSIMYR
jgi:hypothetical protein